MSAQNGLLIRDRVAFERAHNIDVVIFDKTGTLTTGRFGVTYTFVFSDIVSEAELLDLAASVEQNSEHPIARAIAATAPEAGPVEDFRAIPGKGAKGRVGGRDVADEIGLVKSDPLDAVAIIGLSKATYRKMVQNWPGRQATISSLSRSRLGFWSATAYS